MSSRVPYRSHGLKPAISIICPTRGRPEGLRRMVESALGTAAVPGNLQFVCIFDDDDDTRSEAWKPLAQAPHADAVLVPRGEMPKSGLWNYGLDRAQADILMVADDDLVFRAEGWDRMVLDAFAHGPEDKHILVHGPDGSDHCRNLAMHTFLHRKSVDLLGFIQPPYFSHDWGDCWIDQVFRENGRVVWIEGLFIEHMHAAFGKAAMDATYQESLERWKRDRPDLLYQQMEQQRRADVETLRLALRRPVQNVAAVFLWHGKDRHHLPRLLKSLDGAVDQLVAVRTDGSPDGPGGIGDLLAELANPLRVVQAAYPWADHFAEARNVARELAETEWVLSIDADEELLEDAPGALRKVCTMVHDPVDGLFIPLSSRTSQEDAAQQASGGPQIRLFRRQRIRWQGRIHEQVFRQDGSEPAIARQRGVSIRHWGYIPEQNDMEAKRQRNEGLLHLAMQEEPENPIYPFQLGEHFLMPVYYNPREALTCLRQAIQLWRRQDCPQRGYASYMFALAMNAAIELKLKDEALKLWAETPNGLRTAEQAYLLAKLYGEVIGNIDECERWLRRAADDPELLRGVAGDPATYGWKVHENLARVYEMRARKGREAAASA